MNFIKVKYFCSTKDTHERMKTQITDKDKILAKHISDKAQYAFNNFKIQQQKNKELN